MIADSWFRGMRCVIGMSKLGFKATTMIKTITTIYYKHELKDKNKLRLYTNGVTCG